MKKIKSGASEKLVLLKMEESKEKRIKEVEQEEPKLGGGGQRERESPKPTGKLKEGAR